MDEQQSSEAVAREGLVAGERGLVHKQWDRGGAGRGRNEEWQ